MLRRDAFQAIADPTRRSIIAVLVKKPSTLNKLAENFTISRPAVSKQVKILNQCGLIKITPKGRERHCEVDLAKLRLVVDWLEEYRSFWAIPSESEKNVLLQEKELDKEEEKKITKKPKTPAVVQYELF